MKPGRNDPCPCGSGKKYKQCCLAKSVVALEDPAVLLWQRIRRELEGSPARMLRFVLDAYGEEAIDEAWSEFTLGDKTYADFDPYTPQIPVFMPWMFHRWAPKARTTDVIDTALHGVSPTAAWMLHRGRKLDPLLRDYFEACLDTPFGFVEVLTCDAGSGFRVRNVFTAQVDDVFEQSASRSLSVGDLIYGQVIRVKGIAVMEGFSPIAIPPKHKVELIALRQELRADFGEAPGTADDRDWEDILRERYLLISDALLNPVPPVLQNTDGHDLAMQRIVFDIDSAQVAFDKLRHLDLMQSEAEILEVAERDAEGNLRKIAFDWHRLGNSMHSDWDNTVLGRIEIDGPRLIVQVNSDERAAEARRLVERAMGKSVRYRDTEQLSDDPGEEASMDDDSLSFEWEGSDGLEDADAQAAIAAYMTAHLERWPEQPLPALAGRTPLDAIRDADGREMVEALVRQMERMPSYAPPQTDPAALRRLRERLGLAPSIGDGRT